MFFSFCLRPPFSAKCSSQFVVGRKFASLRPTPIPIENNVASPTMALAQADPSGQQSDKLARAQRHAKMEALIKAAQEAKAPQILSTSSGNQQIDKQNAALDKEAVLFSAGDQQFRVALFYWPTGEGQAHNEDKDGLQQAFRLGIRLAHSQPGLKHQEHQIILMPLEHAEKMRTRLSRMADSQFRFNNDGMDCVREVRTSEGNLQRLVTYRVPGMLYGELQSALFISCMTEESDSDCPSWLRFSDQNASSSSSPSADSPVFISQHCLLPKRFRLWKWKPVVNSIPVPRKSIPSLIHSISALLNHPHAHSWRQTNLQEQRENEEENAGLALFHQYLAQS